jgi:cytochrome c oxidase subunit I+III
MFVLSAIGGAVALVSMVKWLWESDPAPSARLYPIGAGIELPDHMEGAQSHSWWAMVVLLLVDGAIFSSLVFCYFYLWTVTPSGWPPSQFEFPAAASSVLAVLAWIGSSALISIAHRGLRTKASAAVIVALLLIAVLVLWGAFVLTFQAIAAANVRPDAHAYGAVLYTLLAWQGLHAVLISIMGGYTIARAMAGLIDDTRRNTFDNTRLMWHYTVAQGVVAFCVMHAPRILG